MENISQLSFYVHTSFRYTVPLTVAIIMACQTGTWSDWRNQHGLVTRCHAAKLVCQFTAFALAEWSHSQDQLIGFSAGLPPYRLALQLIAFHIHAHHHPRAPACRHVKSSCRSILHKLTRERGPCTINPIGGVVPSQVSPVEAVHPPATGFGPTRHLVRSPSSAQTG